MTMQSPFICMTLAPLIVLYSIIGLSGCDLMSGAESQIDSEQLQKLTRAVLKNEGQVSAEQLSDWIIKDTRDFNIIDLREAEAYGNGHIQQAINQTLESTLSETGLEALVPHKKQVLVSASGQRSSTVTTILRLRGFEAYSLEGGYAGWLRYTSDPDSMNTADASARARHQAVACYFEGEYVADAGLTVRVQSAGFTPSLTPVATPPASVEEIADPLGLGLGMGDEDSFMLTPEEAPAGLVLGEGC